MVLLPIAMLKSSLDMHVSRHQRDAGPYRCASDCKPMMDEYEHNRIKSMRVQLGAASCTEKTLKPYTPNGLSTFSWPRSNQTQSNNNNKQCIKPCDVTTRLNQTNSWPTWCPTCNRLPVADFARGPSHWANICLWQTSPRRSVHQSHGAEGHRLAMLRTILPTQMEAKHELPHNHGPPNPTIEPLATRHNKDGEVARHTCHANKP